MAVSSPTKPASPSLRARKATEQLREANLSIVLRLIRQNEPISRSALTQLTGLNRSTIGAVVGQLEADGWIETIDQPVRGPGRPSPSVRTVPTHCIIAVNPEIDGIAIGLIRLNGSVIDQMNVSASASWGAAGYIDKTVSAALTLLAAHPELRPPLGVGFAVPGLVDTVGVVRNAPHLGWRDVPLVEAALAAFGIPVFAANDAACGALAERTFGAAVSSATFVFLNGGASGIGASMFTDHHRVLGESGFAGEWGHTVVAHGSSDGRDTVEDLVGQRHMEAVLGEPITELTPAIEQRDPQVAAEINRQFSTLALTLRNIVNVLNPATVVLGGYLSVLEQYRPGWLEEAVHSSSLDPIGKDVRIIPADLGLGALLVGAAELVAEHLPTPIQEQS